MTAGAPGEPGEVRATVAGSAPVTLRRERFVTDDGAEYVGLTCPIDELIEALRGRRGGLKPDDGKPPGER